MSDDPKNSPEETIRVCVDIPKSIIKRFDELKAQWGLQDRGAVVERLLMTVLGED